MRYYQGFQFLISITMSAWLREKKIDVSILKEYAHPLESTFPLPSANQLPAVVDVDTTQIQDPPNHRKIQ